MKPLLLAALTFASLPTAASAQDAAFKTATPQLKKFVANLLVPPQKASKRFTVLPRLEIASSSPELRTFAETTFSEIVKEGRLTQEPPPGEKQPVFYVFIGTDKELRANPIMVRRNLVARLRDGHGFDHDIRGKTDQVLTEAAVFLVTSAMAKSKDPAGLSKHLMLRDMLKAFGFVGSSGSSKEKELEESCFADNNKALRDSLSPLDRLVIAFTYRFVPPNQNQPGIFSLMQKNWPKLWENP